MPDTVVRRPCCKVDTKWSGESQAAYNVNKKQTSEARCHLILYGEYDAVQHLELLEDLVGDRVEGDRQRIAGALTHAQWLKRLNVIRVIFLTA